MASRALSNILGGIMSGAAGAMKDRRLRREEEESWLKEKGRKREMMDMQEEYGERREDRRRSQRKADEKEMRAQRKSDEQEMYDLSQTRLKQLQQQQLDKIAKLYPDRWQDPKFQQDVTSGILGIKVPALPANKKIAELANSGKIDAALSMAFQSKNPEDLKFYQDVIAAISQRKRLDMLLNPAKYRRNEREEEALWQNRERVIQNTLDQGQRVASNVLSQFIPFQQNGIRDTITRGTPQKSRVAPADLRAEKTRLKELVAAQQNIVKELASRKDGFDLSATQKAAIEKEYNNAVERMRIYQQQYMSLLEGNNKTGLGRRSIKDIFNAIDEI